MPESLVVPPDLPATAPLGAARAGLAAPAIRRGPCLPVVWRWGWIAAAVAAPSTVLVGATGRLSRLIAVEDGSRELRSWTTRIARDNPGCHVRSLGVVDLDLPWYAGLAFSQEELIEAVTGEFEESVEAAEARARATAHCLSLRDLPAAAETRVGPWAETIAARACEMDADLILVRAGSVDRRRLRRLLEVAPCAVLLVRDRAHLRPRAA